MFDFSKHVVMVTGGSGQLGETVVRAFQGAGAKLVIPDRTTDHLEQLFSDLGDGHLLASGVDATNAAQVDQLATQVQERFGRLDILVNTLGGYRAGKPLHETSLQDWDFDLNLNAKSIFIICRAMIPLMLPQNYGKIINVSARASLAGGANHSAYSASKSAVNRLTESMAAEYFQHGLRINAVLPLALDTPRGREGQAQADYSHWITPAALAKIILFLASPDADPITGALIPV